MSALKPYEPTSAHRWLDAQECEVDSREKLQADVNKFCLGLSDSGTVVGTEPLNRIRNAAALWLNRQAAITERDCRRPNWEYCETCETIAELKAELEQYEGVDEAKEMWAKACERERAKNAELIAERDALQAMLDMEHEVIDGLRESLDETIDERNALVRCLEADCGMRASWDGQRNCWTIEATSEHMDARRELLAKLSEMECTWMPLPVDADGVPCRIGDVLDWDGLSVEVMAVSNDCVWLATDANEMRLMCYESREFRHAKPDTVESLLVEYSVACEDQGWKDPRIDGLVEEFAERIRKAVER